MFRHVGYSEAVTHVARDTLDGDFFFFFYLIKQLGHKYPSTILDPLMQCEYKIPM